MTIDGNATTIHHNGSDGDGCGLNAFSSSSIHLVSPLTKEMISTNNHGGQNYFGTIQTITKQHPTTTNIQKQSKRETTVSPGFNCCPTTSKE